MVRNAKQQPSSKSSKKPARPSLVAAAASKDPAQLRELREAEAKLQGVQAALRLEQLKRRQAEQELAESREREALFLATENQFRELSIKRGKKHGVSKSPAVPIIAACDWHAEATVDPRVVSDLNTYNLDVFRKRVNRLRKNLDI